jgi:hypothetical protein
MVTKNPKGVRNHRQKAFEPIIVDLVHGTLACQAESAENCVLPRLAIEVSACSPCSGAPFDATLQLPCSSFPVFHALQALLLPPSPASLIAKSS